VRYKRVDVLIEAMRSLDATLLVVGDGPERPTLERLVHRASLDHKVIFAGSVRNDRRSAYYHAADLFVLPSATRAEGFSIAMLEAMACGTPAVCTEVGTGTSWLNVDGETGLVVPPGGAPHLAAAVRALLGDDSRRRAMAEAAAQRARLQFPKRAMLESTAALYRSLSAAGASAGDRPPRSSPAADDAPSADAVGSGVEGARARGS
jgi:rhamnosyl/mannosyltransferase